jgi:catechol 2,3-dioxygenase-like lactoylglutathione lyase family enzyme
VTGRDHGGLHRLNFLGVSERPCHVDLHVVNISQVADSVASDRFKQRRYLEVMGVTRIVPNLPVSDVARANDLYAQIFELRVDMDLGWVGNLGAAEGTAVQLQVMTSDAAAACNPTISVGVATPDEVDAIHERVVAAGLEIVHPLTDEDWGVHRFFFRDHDGNVVNVVAHP